MGEGFEKESRLTIVTRLKQFKREYYITMFRINLLLIALLALAACSKENVAADGTMQGQITANCTGCTVTVYTSYTTEQSLTFPNTTSHLYFKYDKGTTVNISVTTPTNQSVSVSVWNNQSVQVYQSVSTAMTWGTTQSFAYSFQSK